MDVHFVRKQYSALDGDWVLFENAGGTQVPNMVMQNVSDFYRTANVQPGDFYPKAVQSEEVLQEAHQVASDLIGASSRDQIIFGPSATAINRMMAVSFLQQWQEGDEIIVTVSDHEANVNPWVFLQKYGIKVRFLHIDRMTFELNLKELESLLSSRTVMVAFPHISNILGTENKVTEITRMAHDANAWVYVDGVASTPHKPIDVTAWDVDFFVFSSYKTFGPHMAALYGKKDILLNLERANHFFLPNKTPKKFELGTPNIEGCAAMIGLKEYFQNMYENEYHATASSHREMFVKTMQGIHEYEMDLADTLLEGLSQDSRIRIIGLSDREQLERRVPVIAFKVEGEYPERIVKRMAEQKIALGSGHFYAYRLIDYLELMDKGGVIRASLVHYNTREEVDRFLDALYRVI